MKYIAIAFALLLGGTTVHASQAVEASTPILELKQDNMYPVSHGTVMYQPECGDSFERVELTELGPSLQGERQVGVKVIVLRDDGIACVMRPWPETADFTVSTEYGPVVLFITEE